MSYLPVGSRRWAASVWSAPLCRRTYRRTTGWAFGLALVAGLAGMGMAQAAPPATFTATAFEPSIVVAGTPLQLNGAGTRFRAVFRVYDLALYTTRKVSTAAELLAVPGPKRLQFTALRDLPTTDLGRMFFRGMGDNATKAQMQRHAVESARLIEVFSGRTKLLTGESFGLEYVPGKGTTFFLLGKPQGAPLGDEEFFQMMLNIWVGPSPPDFMLRDALLGLDKDLSFSPEPN